MTRALCFIVALLVGNTLAFAQDWAMQRLEKSPRHLEWVKVQHGDRVVQSFLGYPEVKEKATAVVVIHEIFGLSDWVRGMIDQLAEAGHIAIAPDLLSGAGPQGGGTKELGSGDGVRKAIQSLPSEQVIADLNATVKYVSQLPACNGKVVVCGFCWGGSRTFEFAMNNRDVKAAFVFYGSAPDSADGMARINCPVYGFYGGNDARVNSTIPRTKEAMKQAGKTYEPVIYEGAGHGFMRAGEAPDASPENKKARTEAWQRWKELLQKV